MHCVHLGVGARAVGSTIVELVGILGRWGNATEHTPCVERSRRIQQAGSWCPIVAVDKRESARHKRGR
eukprot:4325702-Prorocentrum_lima.AAC.1